MKLARIVTGLLLITAAQGAFADDAEDIKKMLAEKMPGVEIEVAVKDDVVERIRKSLSERMPEVRIGAITKTPYGGMYEVVVNGINIFYTDEKAEAGFFGNLIELKTQNNLTQQRTAQIRTIDFSSLPLDKSIIRVKGNGQRKLALFSDPDCPFCQQLEKELQGVSDVTIYTFLLPLAELHPDAVRKSELTWCAKDQARAWDDMMLNGKNPEGQAQCETPIKDIAGLADKLGISGTPGMIFGNGRLVPGSMAAKQIEQLLSFAVAKP